MREFKDPYMRGFLLSFLRIMSFPKFIILLVAGLLHIISPKIYYINVYVNISLLLGCLLLFCFAFIPAKPILKICVKKEYRKSFFIQMTSALIAILFFLSVSAISRINGIVLLVQCICILVLFINYQVFLFRAQFAEIMIKTIERELLKEE